MHNPQQQHHLKTNNIISKLAVIVLSFVLLAGISLVSALQIIANEQVQHQQQQHLAFGQAAEESVAGEQTFGSAFDTFVSSEPGGY
jgi:CHASE3 domain sensor protein